MDEGGDDTDSRGGVCPYGGRVAVFITTPWSYTSLDPAPKGRGMRVDSSLPNRWWDEGCGQGNAIHLSGGEEELD